MAVMDFPLPRPVPDPQSQGPYASAEQSAAVIHRRAHSPAERELDRRLEARHANEQGVGSAGYIQILREIAIELLEAQAAGKASVAKPRSPVGSHYDLPNTPGV